MFTREAAQNVFALVNGGHLSIGGLVVRIRYNTTRSFSPQVFPAYVSRVLVIKENKNIVDVHRLHHFLSRNMMFQTQDVYVVEANAEERIIEWVFGSYRAQAATARMALRSEYPQLMLRFGVDPMAATLAERTVATLAVVPAAILPVAEAVVHDDSEGNEAESETSDLITLD